MPNIGWRLNNSEDLSMATTQAKSKTQAAKTMASGKAKSSPASRSAAAKTLRQNAPTQNPSVNFSASWNDQDMIGDLLAQEKQLVGMYSTFVCEGSADPIRKVLTRNFESTVKDQFDVFQQMQNHGWYKTSPADKKQIQTVMASSTQHKTQMSNY